jgi:hypothetical protein
MQGTVLGIDRAKNVLQRHGVAAQGHVVVRKPTRWGLLSGRVEGLSVCGAFSVGRLWLYRARMGLLLQQAGASHA